MALRGVCKRGTPIAVQLPGGTLTVGVGEDDTLTLTGPAETVFEGVVEV